MKIATASLVLFCFSLITPVVVVACSSDSAATTGDDGGMDASTNDVAIAEASVDASAPCNPVKQDCPDPTYKCTIVASGTDRVARCVPPATLDWTKGEGEDCSRSAEGIDDCQVGLACLPNGGAGYACRKLCATDSQCGSAGKCAATTTLAPYYGNCFPTCVAFSESCGDGGTCASTFRDNDHVNILETCRQIGVGAMGSSCTAASDCEVDLICYGTSGFVCARQCDGTHDCGDGGATCSSLTGLTSGVCQ